MGPCCKGIWLVVQFKPYQGAKKEKQVPPSIKWGLGENVVLWLMECLSPTFSFEIFINNYFTSFRLPTHLRVNKIRGTVVLNKIAWQMHYHWGQAAAKKEHYHFEQRTSGKKSSVTLTVAGYDDNRAVYIAFSESCEPNRFVCCWNKVERKYIQEQQPNQFHSYNQNMGFVNRMVQNVAKYRAGIRMKK